MMRLFTHRWFHFLLLFILLLTAVYHSASNERWRKEMQSLVFDELNAFYPRDPSGQVLIIDIDDDSLLKIGQWPWSRNVVADLITNLTALGAKVIAFDGVLAEPDRSSPRYMLDSLSGQEDLGDLQSVIEIMPDHDELLAAAIKESGIVVTGFTYGSYSQVPRKPRLVKPILTKKQDFQEFIEHAEHFQKAAVFLPELEKAAAGNGSFMASPDFDGILRRTGMIFQDGKMLYPSLSLEAVRVAQGDPRLIPKIGRIPEESRRAIDTNFRIIVGEYSIPVEHDGVVWMHYRRMEGNDYLSAYKVIDPEYHDEVRDRIKDKIILIGSSAEGLKDLRSTALEPFQPGVEIHANVIEQILQNDYLLRPNVTAVAEGTFILFAGAMMIILAPFIHVLTLALLCMVLIGVAFLGATSAYVDYKILLDPFYPSLSVLLIFIVSTLLTYLRVESERKQVRNMFGLYVSPDVMRDLERNPEKLKLGGENKNLTIVFTDIRKFTTISEGLTPEELIQMMNSFLTAMTDIVMDHKGTIDKYMGDAMMAFWNAPKDVENHEREACLAALKMQEALEPINDKITQRAQDENKEPVLLRAGIGINTGVCAVGNMGSKQRFAYSALGDPVNLASRLEGQTKTYDVQILVGEDTIKNISDLAYVEIDLLRVKGKTKPVRVYALLGDDDMAKTHEFQEFKEAHSEMIAAYQAGKFKEAQKALKGCEKLDRYSMKAVHALYTQRLETLLANPPTGIWDGVFEAKTK